MLTKYEKRDTFKFFLVTREGEEPLVVRCGGTQVTMLEKLQHGPVVVPDCTDAEVRAVQKLRNMGVIIVTELTRRAAPFHRQSYNVYRLVDVLTPVKEASDV